MVKKFILSLMLFSSLLINGVFAHAADTLRLYYDINVSRMNSSQQLLLDTFFLENNSKEISTIEILAYADFLASAEYNKILSQQRADEVKQYLSAKGFSEYIKLCKGKGELPPELINQPMGIKENRRVEIIIQYKPARVEQTKKFEINEIKVGTHIILENLNFLPGRHFLTRASQPQLEILLKNLIENPELHIEIQGHICCEYTGRDGLDQDTYTNDLSLNRAKYIYSYLIKNGIAPERLQYKGLGSTSPLIYPERTPEDQNKNRRVEIVITKK